MIYELRTYDIAAGRLAEAHERFERHTRGFFAKHGMRDVAYWTTDAGGSNRELTYLLAFEDANRRMDSWSAFKADPDWHKVAAVSDEPGPLVQNVVNKLLVPTTYSPAI